MFTERDEAGLKLLILSFSGVTKKARIFGEDVSRRMLAALEHYRQEEARSSPWQRAKIIPDSFQIKRVSCVVADHDEARAVGKAWGADVVLSGDASLFQMPPPTVRLQLRIQQEGNTQVITGINNGVINVNSPNLNIRTYFSGARNGTLTTRLTAVNLPSLQAIAERGIRVDDPLRIQEMSFPTLATQEPLALLHL